MQTRSVQFPTDTGASLRPPKQERTAVFEVDVQEPGSGCLVHSARCKPIAAALDRLTRSCDERGLVRVMTTCLNAQAGPETLGDRGVFVPAHEEFNDWSRMAAARTVLLEKPGCGDRQRNIAQQAYNVFRNNCNARAVIEAIGAQRWLVYGTSLEYCVRSVAQELVAMGRLVVLIEDASACGGDGPAAGVRAIAAMRAMGVAVTTSDRAASVLWA